jgi:hypothetical protein
LPVIVRQLPLFRIQTYRGYARGRRTDHARRLFWYRAGVETDISQSGRILVDINVKVIDWQLSIYASGSCPGEENKL